jgi:membrane-associated protease RseP (regulator of RpoE activity)
MKKLLAVLLCLGLCGCATNPYKDFYHTKGVDPFKAGEAIMPPVDAIPEIIEGNLTKEDIKADSIRMRENNYKLLGYSSFSASEISSDKAIAFGKEIHAEKIIMYAKYKHTVSGSMPMTLPNVQTSNTNGMIGSTFVSAQTTTYGSETTYIPYSVNRYDYFASFWAKATPAISGFLWDDLTDDLKKQIGSNKGVIVMGVRKDSPAFNADFFKGDIIKKVDDTEIGDKNMFKDLLDKVSGKKVTITFLRDGKELTKTIQMNPKPNVP